MPPASPSRRIRFATFEVDFTSGELRKNGLRVRLQDQPLKVLAVLVDRAGEVVTREELQQAVWSTDTFVDFEQGLNKAINKLREALEDSAEHSRFIETLPRRGYRFVAKLEAPAPPVPTEGMRAVRADWQLGNVMKFTISGLAIGLAITFALNILGLRDRLLKRAAPPSITSLAVLPFANLSGDLSQEYFVDGLHDELITQLGQVGSLKVISRTSVLRYKLTKLTTPQIARELDVESVLEGSVRLQGDRVHVTAQLIYAPEDRHIWARSYDRDIREAWAIPGEIARAVIEAQGFKLTQQERTLLASTQPVDPEVFRAYLKGRYFETKYTNEGYHRAIDFFQEAIDRDPGYARAWAEIGHSYESLSKYALNGKDLSEQEALQKASVALERALELDPNLKRPHTVLARIKLNKWDWDGGAREIEKVRELDPSFHGGEFFLTLSGRPEEAILDARRNVERDPFGYAVQVILGWTYFIAERHDQSIVELKRAAAMDPANDYAHFELGWNYAKKGMFPEAISECDTALEFLHRKQPDAVVATDCGWVYALAGRRRQALAIARQLEKTSEEDENCIMVAHIYDALGERETALLSLERAFRVHAWSLPREWCDPKISKELRADPRFQELMRRTGNPWIHFPPLGGSLASVGTVPALRKQP